MLRRLIRLSPLSRASGAPFRDRLEDFSRLDWQILRNGAIALYHRRAVLDDDRVVLAALRYRVIDLDAGAWRTTGDLHDAIQRALALPGQYGRNLAALVDALTDLAVPDDGGLALVVRHFDTFARHDAALATAVLEAIESSSRHHLLFGRRFLALVQSDDATLRFAPVGARPIVLNPRESSATARTLGAAE